MMKEIDAHSKLKKALLTSATEGHLSCAEALAIAKELTPSHQELRKAIEDTGLKVIECQLGLFGCSKKQSSNAEQKLLDIIKDCAIDGKLTCSKAREISIKHGVSLRAIGKATNQCNIKFVACSLGFF